MRIDHAALINVGADVDVHRGHADDATRDVGACPNGGSSRDESDLILQRDRLKGIGILVEKWKPLGRVIDQTSDPEAQQDSFFHPLVNRPAAVRLARSGSHLASIERFDESLEGLSRCVGRDVLIGGPGCLFNPVLEVSDVHAHAEPISCMAGGLQTDDSAQGWMFAKRLPLRVCRSNRSITLAGDLTDETERLIVRGLQLVPGSRWHLDEVKSLDLFHAVTDDGASASPEYDDGVRMHVLFEGRMSSRLDLEIAQLAGLKRFVAEEILSCDRLEMGALLLVLLQVHAFPAIPRPFLRESPDVRSA